MRSVSSGSEPKVVTCWFKDRVRGNEKSRVIYCLLQCYRRSIFVNTCGEQRFGARKKEDWEGGVWNLLRKSIRDRK
jgi:hypothetical protein